MKLAYVIHWKTNNAPGVRGFSERSYAEQRVLSDGGDLKDLRQLAPDCFVYWPPSLGAFPTRAQLAAWEDEYDARPRTKTIEERVVGLEQKLDGEVRDE